MCDLFSRLRTAADFKLEEISDFGMISSAGYSLLQEALEARKNQLAFDLIEKAVPLDHQDGNGQTALQYAIIRSENAVANMILSKGANPNLVDTYGNNALWTAVMNPRPDYELVQALVKAGADINRKNNAGRSAMDMAEKKQDTRLKAIFSPE